MTRYRQALIAPLLLAATLATPAQAHASGWSSLWFKMMNWVEVHHPHSLVDGRFTVTV